MMKIGSSSMLTGAYLANKARRGAMINVGRSILATNDAMMRLRSSFELSTPSSICSLGKVFLAKLAPRTTRIKGTATCPFWSIARVMELRTNVPSSKNKRCNAGIDATITAISMAHRGGFINSQVPRRNRPTQFEVTVRDFCNQGGRRSKI